ncbi:MAG: DUF5721 family protein [Clostridiales bacterium]|nr:DUF5721 family protein [Clostridiales bacterium]
MIALKMEDIRLFTSRLFVGEAFDSWLVREAMIVTFNTFTIDGHTRRGFFSEEEMEAEKIGELSSWRQLRPFCYSLIRGKKLPESFRITLQLSPENVEKFLKSISPGFTAGQIAGLYLDIRYENLALHCVSGTSLKVFTLDKQIEQEWDGAVRRYMKELKLPYVEE